MSEFEEVNIKLYSLRDFNEFKKINIFFILVKII